MKLDVITQNLDRITETYVTAYTLAGPTLQAMGAAWYPTALEIARAMAKESGYTVRQCAAVIAALSPRMPWEQNIEAAWDIVRRGPNAKRPNGKSWQTDANTTKALRALTVSSLDVARLFADNGKTGSFWSSIVYCEQSDCPAFTLDAWMLRAVGLPESLKPVQYAVVEDAASTAFTARGISAPAAQAVIWLYVRDVLALQPGESIALDSHGAYVTGTGLRGLSRDGARLYRLA